MSDFVCEDCGKSFSLPAHIEQRYPGWTPRQCLACRNAARSGSAGSAAETVTDTGDTGPSTGLFTDGGASPNPGPGGWGVVWVRDNEIVDERWGADPDTTNNRMELTALIAAADMVPSGDSAVIYADSSLSINTITKWAAGWEQRGWKRKTGPVENLDLVRKAFYAYRSRPELELRWVKGHAGARWNEYADELANRWRSQ